MKRHIVTFAAAVFFAFGVGTVWAQRPTQDSGPSRPESGGRGGGAGDTGSATTSSGGGTSSATSSGSAVSTSSGSTGGGNSIGWGDRPGIDFPRAQAPRRGPGAGYTASGESQERAVPRGRASGGNSGGDQERAVPRGSGAGEGNPRGSRAVPRDDGIGRGTTSLAAEGGGREPGQVRQRAPVPTYSRPRDGRTPIGSPVDRSTAISRGVYNPYYGYGYPYGSSFYPYGTFGYYSRYGWYPGYGFGLGYFYDPFWSGYGGFGYGYPYGGYGGYGGGAGYYRARGYDTGSLRLKVQPRDAKVYVDGYFVGVVDSFDGVFQKLAVEGGTHRVEIRAEGFEPAQFEIMVTPGETITYKGQLKPHTP